MKKTPKFQINDLVLKTKSNHIFQIVKIFNIGKRSIKYRLRNLSTSSETAPLESQIERKATIKELEAQKRLPEEKVHTIEKLVLSSIGPYKDSWAIIYIDLNDTYSAGGGRITVILDDDNFGSAFFSHVGQPTFKSFIAQCDADYLIRKLFYKISRWIPVEDGNELIEAVYRENKDEIKELRSEGIISKTALRELFDELKDCEFEGMNHLWDWLDETNRNTIARIIGSDWCWDSVPSKLNSKYEYLEHLFNDVIAEFKKLDEVMV